MSYFNHKEVEILNQISKNHSVSQRELAKIIGISLGLINAILKKLTKSGLIEMSHPNKRNIEYTLTPLGLLETTKRRYHSTTETIRNFKKIQIELGNLLQELYGSGYDYFSIHGDGELKEIVEAIFMKTLEEAPVTLAKEHKDNPRAVVLKISTDLLDPAFKGDVVDVLSKVGVI